MSLSSFSVKKPVTICMLFFGVILVGVVSLSRLPVELMPNVAYGDVSIIVGIRGGMAPQEVETLVTKPIEEAVSTVSYLQNLYSTSKAGESRVYLSFEPGTDMNFASLEVREKFSKIRDKLPKEIQKPVIAQYKESDKPVLVYAIMSKDRKHSPEMLRRIVDEQLKERILRVEGVANVDVYGGRERKILVEVDKHKLFQYNVAMEKVVGALGSNNLNLLAGDVAQRVNKYLIRVMGEFESLEDIKNIGVSVTPQGSIIKLGEIATVKDSFLEPTNYARTDIEPVVSIYIQKSSTANTIRVVKDIEKEMALVIEELEEGIEIKSTMNQASTIEGAIGAVQTSLFYGSILAVLILLVFLRNFRVTSIIGVTIPISVMATFILMFGYKISINVMTLSGLALGIGMLMDNSIVVLDNIDKSKQKVNFGKPDWKMQYQESVITGASEVGLAIVAATITTIVVFLPFIFVNKEMRMLWSGLALTVTFSLLSSLFVALTLVPMMSDFIKRKPRPGKPREKIIKKRTSIDVQKYYKNILSLALKLRYVLVAMAFGGLVLVAMFVGSKIPKEFTAGAGEGRFTIFVELEPGAKLDVTDMMVKETEEVLSEIPEIRNFTARVEPGSGKVYVKLIALAKRERSTKDVMDEIRAKTDIIGKKYKGGFIYFSEISEKGLKEVVIDLYGYQYEPMKETATSIATRLGTIEGFQDIRMSRIKGRPEWGVAVDREKAAQFGLSVKDVADMLHSQMRGLRATLYHTESREVATISRIQREYVDRVDDLRKLIVFTKDGAPIYLEQVAALVPRIGSSEIVRKNKMRVIHITSTVTTKSLVDAVGKVKEALSDMEFPKDYYYRIGGTYERDIKNEKELMAFPTGVLWITLFLVYLVLASLFESYSQPFIIMMSVPLSAIGVILALKFTERPISQGVIMGGIMLAGIVVNNAIVLVDRINFLRKKNKRDAMGNRENLLTALVNAGEDRLRPIAMTTSTTILGLVPMAFDRSESASLWSPLAITVIGGMASSTLLTLLLIPSIYLIFEDFRRLILRPK